MRTYPAEKWKQLGQWIQDARLAAGIADMREWAVLTDRSTRQMQGLERGDRVGEKTLINVAKVLGVEPRVLFSILSDATVEPPPAEATLNVTVGTEASATVRNLSEVPDEALIAELARRVGTSRGREVRKALDEIGEESQDPG